MVAAVADWFNRLDLPELSVGGGAGVAYVAMVVSRLVGLMVVRGARPR